MKKIAILRALKLGDILCAIPAIRAIRNEFPYAEITYIGLPWTKGIISRFPMYFNHFINFPGWPGLPEQRITPKKILKFLSQVQKEKFDLIFQMQGNGTYVNNLMDLFGAKLTAGFYLPHEHSYCPNIGTYLPYPDHGHEIERLLCLTDFLGIKRKGTYLEFPLNEIYYRVLDREKHYVVIHPGSTSGKRWAEENFAEVANGLLETDYQIVISGTKEERFVTGKVKRLIKGKVIDLTGKTDLGALGILVKNASLLLSNDTGISHIAAALKTPSIIILTTSEKERWAPLDKKLHVAIKEDQITNNDEVVNVAINLLNSKLK